MSISRILILTLFACCNAFIVPEELPTLLSVIYSNIPPVKLGFDTRFGFGFRIGPHLDFQTIVELGPQQNTRPIGFGNETIARRRSPAETPGNRKSQPDGGAESNLARILLGRQKNWKMDGIEFKKVPGIDDVKKKKIAKGRKSGKSKSPTKIVIF